MEGSGCGASVVFHRHQIRPQWTFRGVTADFLIQFFIGCQRQDDDRDGGNRYVEGGWVREELCNGLPVLRRLRVARR